jgi:hypothetical protein
MGRTACTEPQCLYNGALYLTYSYTSTPRMGRTACTEPQCLYKGALYLYLTVELNLFFPLWAVLPLQSVSACTRVDFTFT